jgi:RAB protein geranylgeranyltransferase component A
MKLKIQMTDQVKERSETMTKYYQGVEKYSNFFVLFEGYTGSELKMLAKHKFISQ